MQELKTNIKQNEGYMTLEIYLEEKLVGSSYSYKKVLELSLPDAIILGSDLINKASMFTDKIYPMFPLTAQQEGEAEVVEIEEPVGLIQRFRNWIKETL